MPRWTPTAHACIARSPAAERDGHRHPAALQRRFVRDHEPTAPASRDVFELFELAERVR
jgi:hypothetical protein